MNTTTCTLYSRLQAVSAQKIIADGGVGVVEHVSCSMHSPLLWLFDDPKNKGWVSTEGTSMRGNGFGWGQLSHLLAWIFKATSLSPTEAYAVREITESMLCPEPSGCDFDHSLTLAHWTSFFQQHKQLRSCHTRVRVGQTSPMPPSSSVGTAPPFRSLGQPQFLVMHMEMTQSGNGLK